MDNEMVRPKDRAYTLEFANGLKFEHLKRNGTSYIFGEALDESVFTEDALKSLKITDETNNTSTIIKDVVYCGSFIHPDDKLHHAGFAPKPTNVKMREKLEHVTEVATDSAADITDVQEALAEVYELMIAITSELEGN